MTETDELELATQRYRTPRGMAKPPGKNEQKRSSLDSGSPVISTSSSPNSDSKKKRKEREKEKERDVFAAFDQHPIAVIGLSSSGTLNNTELRN